MKYYIYISVTKVNMLYPQIPPAFLKGAEAEMKINLGVISTTIKGRGPDAMAELPAQVAAVASYLKGEHAVGSIDNPRKWIAGSLPMRWGCISEYASDIAFFGGATGGKTIALVGASDSVIGTSQSAGANHGPLYYKMKFLNSLFEEFGFKASRYNNVPLDALEDDPELKQPGYADLVGLALNTFPDTEENLEFLALVLKNEPNLIVATPLYVALAD